MRGRKDLTQLAGMLVFYVSGHSRR